MRQGGCIVGVQESILLFILSQHGIQNPCEVYKALEVFPTSKPPGLAHTEADITPEIPSGLQRTLPQIALEERGWGNGVIICIRLATATFLLCVTLWELSSP